MVTIYLTRVLDPWFDSGDRPKGWYLSPLLVTAVPRFDRAAGSRKGACRN